MIRFIGDGDPTTRRMMEEILAMEEEHAEDLSTMLADLGHKGEPAKLRK
jgi:bacterioferritin